ncbi:phage tail spike protein [Convivina intestini]|uniref:Phage minor structural protein n=1 Tax=Convivina intestini TaxID=1505726 RepID=A0A2U1D4G3_9LACO|nr:phage tail spike protein [Convivina intestini]PVY82540.1 phage minor structural protein [Convivina intestini]SDC17294.1 phage minor structural protein, N-terminal region [Leuconostocaceae bacterium R-53105]
MMYLFDKRQNIIGLIDKSDLIEAHLDVKINQAITLDFSVPATIALDSKARYIGVPHPLKPDNYVMLRIMSIKDQSDRTEYSAYELAYQELNSYGYIKDRRFKSENAYNLMTVALGGSTWNLGVCVVPGLLQTNYYFDSNLDAITKVVNGLGGEVVFYVAITGSKITGRYMDYVIRQGEDTSKVFVHGSNLLTVERTGDNSSIYTAILPRGKGEQVSEGHDDTPDGYGRRITIEDLEWSKYKGDPMDKVKGDLVLTDPEATLEYGHIDGTPRLLIKTYDQIDDTKQLLRAAYNDLMAMNHPAIQYSATIAETDGLSLGDTVLIMHDKRKLSYKTRVFEVNYDLTNPSNTTIQLGSDLSKGGMTNRVNSLSSSISVTSEMSAWTMTHGGHNDTTFGVEQPTNPRKGNVWFKNLPNGKTELYYYDGNAWVLEASTDSQWDKNSAELNGDHTVYRGPDNPVNPQQGDTWYKDDVNEPNGVAMYAYSGSTWVKFNGITDANRLQQGIIDANRVNVLNLDANNISTGHLSANFIKGGQIDAAQIDVINLNVNSLVGNFSQFIRSRWDGSFGSTFIDGSGMKVSTTGVNTKFNSGGMTLNMNDEDVGGVGVAHMSGMPDNYQGLGFQLNGKGDYMTWSARNTGIESGNFGIKLSWFRKEWRAGGYNSGFTFDDDVVFRAGVRMYEQGGDLREILGQLAAMDRVVIPKGFDSEGKATSWVTIK